MSTTPRSGPGLVHRSSQQSDRRRSGVWGVGHRLEACRWALHHGVEPRKPSGWRRRCHHAVRPQSKEATQSGSFVSVRVGKRQVATQASVTCSRTTAASARGGRADMNDMPRFEVDPEALLTITVGKGQNARTAPCRAAASGEVLVDLVWDEMRLSQSKPSVSPNSWCATKCVGQRRAPELAEAFSWATTPSSTCGVTLAKPPTIKKRGSRCTAAAAESTTGTGATKSSCTPLKKASTSHPAPTDMEPLAPRPHR